MNFSCNTSILIFLLISSYLCLFTNQGNWFSKLLLLVTLPAYFGFVDIYCCMDRFLCFLPLCRHKVVIVEGNYLLLEDGVWKEISSLFDEKWQVLILSRHMFLHIFFRWPWKFWKLYVNSVMKIQPWACDTLLENSSVKIILMKDNRMFTELYIQLN